MWCGLQAGCIVRFVAGVTSLSTHVVQSESLLLLPSVLHQYTLQVKGWLSQVWFPGTQEKGLYSG